MIFPTFQQANDSVLECCGGCKCGKPGHCWQHDGDRAAENYNVYDVFYGICPSCGAKIAVEASATDLSFGLREEM